MSFFKDLFAGKKAKLKTPEERKAASIQRLKKEGIPYIEHLPVIEGAEQVRPRSLEEIARRAITSLLIIQAPWISKIIIIMRRAASGCRINCSNTGFRKS